MQQLIYQQQHQQWVQLQDPPASAAATTVGVAAVGTPPGQSDGVGAIVGQGGRKEKTNHYGRELWLWKLKESKPDLFKRRHAEREKDAAAVRAPPPGFAEHADGWLYNAGLEVFMEKSSGRRFGFDAVTGEYYPCRDGQSYEDRLAVVAEAAVTSGGSSCSSASSAGVGGAGDIGSTGAGTAATAEETPHPLCRSVIVHDLHRAAGTLRLDLAHLDRPACLVGLFDARADAEAAARGLHTRLLPRLARFRGEWSREALRATLAEALCEGGSIIAPSSTPAVVPAAAAALLLGTRLTLTAGISGRCLLGSGQHALLGPQHTVGAAEDVDARTACFDLEELGCPVTLTLLVGLPALSDGEAAHLALNAAARRRPRAGALTLLRAAHARGSGSAGIVACVQFAWTASSSATGDRRLRPMSSTDAGLQKVSAVPVEEADAAPVPKRSRAEVRDQVRVRHILLRHTSGAGGGGGATTTGTAGAGVAGSCKGPREKARSREEAEGALLGVLEELDAAVDLSLQFTAHCRTISECPSSLKGGELAGDLGWLDKRGTANVPAPVLRAAFGLSVGQLSDVVASSEGSHLLLRIA